VKRRCELTSAWRASRERRSTQVAARTSGISSLPRREVSYAIWRRCPSMALVLMRFEPPIQRRKCSQY